MKLNKRVSYLIFPVLLCSYLVVALGVYSTQKNGVIQLERRSLDLHLAEANAVIERYLLVTNSFINSLLHSNSLINYFNSSDKHFKALSLEKGLKSSIDDLNRLRSDFWSIALIRSSGSVEYYYEDSLDPFVSISDDQVEKVVELFKDKQAFYKSIYDKDQNKILMVRIIDQYTFKTPIDFDNSTSVAIAIIVDPTAFKEKLEDLKVAGLLVDWPVMSVEADSDISSYLPVSNLGHLRISASEERIQGKLNTLKFNLAFGFILVTFASYLILMFLIGQYVTGPIKKLQQKLSQVNLEKGVNFKPSGMKDEIGELSRTFNKLYESLIASYTLTKELAEKDTLTKLYNRRFFQEKIEEEVISASAQKRSLTLLYLDIDNFKYVNDSYGHDVGDLLLQEFSQHLEREVCLLRVEGYNNYLSRLAGDEFSILISSIQDREEIESVCQRLLNICPAGFTIGSTTYPISLSIGVAFFPDSGSSVDTLMKHADEAMYDAKGTGKNKVSFYTEALQQKSKNEKVLEVALRQLDLSDLSLLYMPVFTSEAFERVYAVEALLRWDSPDLGPLLPEDFMSVAEGMGLFEEIDAWVIEQVFKDFPSIGSRLGDDIRVCINISSAQLSSLSFMATLSKLMCQYKIDSRSFELEISESFSGYTRHKDTGLMKMLKDLGFRLSLDDFGAGHISVAQLVEYPIDCVKLNSHFVDNLSDDIKRDRILELIKFCRSQGLDVVAEGVENSAQVELLKTAGCSGLEGYYFSQPMCLSALLNRY